MLVSHDYEGSTFDAGEHLTARKGGEGTKAALSVRFPRGTPHHGAVEGGCSARQHRLMQNETRQTTTAAAFGRSSVARLPPTLREAVDAAIADGATIDEITALIRGEGGACSRSAVGRYTKNMRDLIRQQQEADRANEAWVRALGARAQGRAGLILIETLRTLVLSTLADLSKREDAA